MTHPDICQVMRTGYLYPPTRYVEYDRCAYCGSKLYHDGFERVKSAAGYFCNLACCHKYHQIEIE